jgi:hypothetical protein
MHSVSH